MMKKRKLGIIGGSGLYKMEGFKKSKWYEIKTPWGKPSDKVLIANTSLLCSLLKTGFIDLLRVLISFSIIG